MLRKHQDHRQPPAKDARGNRVPPVLKPAHPRSIQQNFQQSGNYRIDDNGIDTSRANTTMHRKSSTRDDDIGLYSTVSDLSSGVSRSLDVDNGEYLRIQRVVSMHVYREMKFINDQAELDAYHDAETLGFYVMEKLKIHESKRCEYWSKHKDDVNKQINVLRCTNTNAIKKVWKGENRMWIHTGSYAE
jgi:hypothetical protein